MNKKDLRARVNELMNGYEWKYIDPETGEELYDPSQFGWESDVPMKYKYRKGTKPPFKGVCIEQAKYIKDHIPNTKILFRAEASPAINAIHAAPVIEDKGKLRPVYLKPRPYEEYEQNYLGKEGYDDLDELMIDQLPRRVGEDKLPFDFYWLDDIPNKGDAISLRRYARKNGTPVRVRNKKIIDPNNPKYRKNFDKIVKRYMDRYGIDLSNIKYYEDTIPQNNRGEYTREFSPEEAGGDWHKDHSIRINPELRKVVKHWNLDMTPKQFADIIVAHELSHDVEHNRKHKAFVRKMLEEARHQNFTTPYLKTVPDAKMDSEMFCEYMAHLLNQKR